ncbi:hypothetical protein E4U40_007201 [Claviceps sp. LM458 group G5]|nr:hypothetical protein E4U40_007201 [Claviceps sp. LM458 group G5]KAG6051051.1 hypothetical protein E4U39_002306 [Claviceps sp. Clav50 group G5]
METITNIAQSASKAIWGTGGEQNEPISGAQGDVTKGEPYDAGNIDANAPEQSITKPDPALNEDLPHNTIANKPDTHADTTKPSPAAVKPSRKPNDDKRNDVVVGEEGEQQPKGPGPKPLAAVAKEHGGDAGNLEAESESKSKGPGSSKDASAKAAADNRDEENKGTGELYVRTSGLAADGGDFDASRPGAGREADRLMEEKGLERDTSDGPNSHKTHAGSSGAGAKSSHDKPSMKERVKEKLHLHKS